jgi:GTP-binding protein
LAINVLPGPLSESYEVQGRGELQLGRLVEEISPILLIDIA